MDWTTILGVIVGNLSICVPLFFWNRSEANADRREMMNLIQAMKDDMRDFHGRLCAIEEKRGK